MPPTIETLPAAEVFSVLKTGPEGLGPEEAADRLAQGGPNLLQERKGGSLAGKFLGNFTHLMALLLWVAGIVAFIAKMPQLGVSIWAVNLINGIFSFWQEYKAEKATEAMRKMLPVYARVRRGGTVRRVPAPELVPGDILLLSEGESISADCRLVESVELNVDQSTLTGESVQVRKTCEPFRGKGVSRFEVSNIAFAGTSVVSGSGTAVVILTGMATEFGKIAAYTIRLADSPSPLQREMKRVTKLVTFIAVGMGIVFFLLASALAGVDLAESFIFGTGMIVAFVPEGLLPTVTLSLAMGVQRMAKRNALIKRLSSVETLGSASVICTDKTGTLTQNEMTVKEIWLAGKYLTVTGTGYAPVGEILDGGRPASVSDGSDLHELLTAATLCNNARLLPPDNESPRWTILGDPTEGALGVLALKAGIHPEISRQNRPRLRELPFDSRRKRMSTLHFKDASYITAYVKGAPGEILRLCSRILINGRETELGESRRKEINSTNDRFARSGFRVLAVARRVIPHVSSQTQPSLSELTIEPVEQDLTFLGLLSLMDPPRPEVSEAVQKCHDAGIRIIMITGDYGLTAESIGRRIGILRENSPRVVSGVDLDRMDEPALKQILSEEVIFARVAPEHKFRVVSALQEMGHVVAVTGDGVNDAPALKKADIGVAMGLSGTDVAKEAADMILTDDNFASIVNAIEEGRAVYANIKKFTTYIFTSNAPEAVPFILFALSRGRIPLALNVMHILAIDLGTDLVPALALGAEPPEPGLMKRPPRSLKEHVITPGLLARAYLWLGLLQSLAVMAAFYFQYYQNGFPGQWLDLPSSGPLYESATAMALACVVTTQIGNLFAQRTERASVFKVGLFGNRLLWIGIVSELIIIFLIVYVPGIQRIIGTRAFSGWNWLFLFAWAPFLLVMDELRKLLIRCLEVRKSKGGGK